MLVTISTFKSADFQCEYKRIQSLIFHGRLLHDLIIGFGTLIQNHVKEQRNWAGSRKI